jgi:glycosyltransferase involved in cell wall biosynthesis
MVLSTNGMDESYFDTPNKRSSSIAALQQFGPGKRSVFLDYCYTVPPNYLARFLPNSQNRAIIYNYETTVMPPEWKSLYDTVDYHFPSSNFCAEVFYRNGVPLEKIFVVPHGVDRRRFNSKVPPLKLKTKKKFKFLSITAPHVRKNIDVLLDAYCQTFTAQDEVCLCLKTKIYKHSDGIGSKQNPNGRKGYELVVGDLFKPLVRKYGKKMPEIEILGGHVENPASIYNACDCHISTTGSEGFGLIFTEAMSCGLLNIVPNYSGHLDFMDNKNALLIKTKLRSAKNTEQYWAQNSKAVIGQPNLKHTMELMRKVYKEHNSLLKKFKPEMEKTAEKYSWENAAQMMIDICQKKINHYIPGTYNWWPK